jgi:hypothetical protein
MADGNTGQHQTPTPPPEERGSVMHAIHEGAQLFEATGVGAGGFATALHFAKAGRGSGTPPQPPQPPTPTDTGAKP